MLCDTIFLFIDPMMRYARHTVSCFTFFKYTFFSMRIGKVFSFFSSQFTIFTCMIHSLIGSFGIVVFFIVSNSKKKTEQQSQKAPLKSQLSMKSNNMQRDFPSHCYAQLDLTWPWLWDHPIILPSLNSVLRVTPIGKRMCWCLPKAPTIFVVVICQKPIQNLC